MPTVIDAIRLPQDDPRLITLAIVIAAITAFAVVSLLARVRMIGRDTLVVWYGAAVVFGCGLWALQFAVLLSLAAPVEVGYDLTLTLMALFVSVVGALGAFAAFLAGRDDWRGPPLAGLMLGVSLVGAHLVGIAAIRPATSSVADDAPLLVPAVMAVGFSMLMFARADGARPVLRRLGGPRSTFWQRSPGCA